MTIDVDKVYEHALELFQNDRIDEALNVVREAKADDPHLGVFYHIAGQLLNSAGRPVEAEAECRAGLKADPSYSPLHLTLTKSLVDQNRYQDALEQSEVYGESSDELDAKIIYYRSDCFAAMREWEMARDEITQAIKIDYEPGHSYVRRSMYNFQLHDWDPVIADSTSALAHELTKRDKAIVLQNRGAARMYTHDYENAEDDLSLAIEIDPNDYLPYFDRAKLYEVTDRPEAALKDLNHGVELCECALHLSERGYFLMSHGYLVQAVHDFEKAVLLDPDPEYAQLLKEARAALAGSTK
jgi:tetratricopeptide (TPR) repeat protein